MLISLTSRTNDRYTSGGGGGSGSGERKEIVKGRAAVDASCPRAEDFHVYDDGTKPTPNPLP